MKFVFIRLGRMAEWVCACAVCMDWAAGAFIAFVFLGFDPRVCCRRRMPVAGDWTKEKCAPRISENEYMNNVLNDGATEDHVGRCHRNTKILSTTTTLSCSWEEEMGAREKIHIRQMCAPFMRLMTRHGRRVKIDNQMMWINIRRTSDRYRTRRQRTHTQSTERTEEKAKKNCYFSHVVLFICQCLVNISSICEWVLLCCEWCVNAVADAEFDGGRKNRREKKRKQ